MYNQKVRMAVCYPGPVCEAARWEVEHRVSRSIVASVRDAAFWAVSIDPKHSALLEFLREASAQRQPL